MITDMVMKYWMDEEIWPIMYFDKSKEEYVPYKTYSEKTAEKIDNKIKDYMNICYKKSKDIITQNKELIDNMSKILLEKEYLTKEEFVLLMNNKPLPKPVNKKKTNIKAKPKTTKTIKKIIKK